MLFHSESSQPTKMIEELDLVKCSNKKAKRGEEKIQGKDCGEGGKSHTSEPEESLRHKISYRDSLFRRASHDVPMEDADTPFCPA